MRTRTSDRAGTGRERSQEGGSRRRQPALPVWEKPRLVVFGDLRQLTMGPSLGTGESGNPLNFRG